MTVVNTPSTFSRESLLERGPILEVVIGYKGEQLDPSNSFLEVGIYQEIIALDLQITRSQDYQALLGRTFLQYFKMEYDGVTGAVTLRKNPQHFS